MRIARDESGQTIPFVVVFLVVLIGMLALVVDVGSWFRAQRQLQATADAAALAGAYSLPDPLLAQSDATRYVTANVNANNTPPTTIAFPTPSAPGGVCNNNSCIAVDLNHKAQGLFAPVLNSLLSSVTVRAHAQAAIVAPGNVKNVAPIAVQSSDACQPPGCTFPHHATLNFDDPGNQFQLLNLDFHDPTTPQPAKSVSTNDMANWTTAGYPGSLPTQSYYALNKNGIQNGQQVAFKSVATSQKVLLIPVFDPTKTDATTKSIFVIGWAAFLIDSNGVNWNNNPHTLTGNFVKFIANGLPAGPGTPGQNFGVVSIVVNG